MRLFGRFRLAMFGALAAAFAGCYSSDAPSRASTPAEPVRVGPAPLRRLSNAEYLNALADLFPALHPEVPALPDDVPVAGFANAAEAQEPSDVRIARYEAIASAYAEAIAADPAMLQKLAGCTEWTAPDRAMACGASFVANAGALLFRRPLETDERDRFAARFEAWRADVDFEGAAQLTLSTMMQSPQFLYRIEPPAPSADPVPVEPYAMASRLSFFLWESVPDEALRLAASRDELRTPEQLSAEVDRMLADPRARRLFWSFPRQWLGLERILLDEHAARTPEVDPAWTAATQAAAFEESHRFVENVLFEGGSLRDLLTSRRAWQNGEMARLYGTAPPADPSAWVETSLPEGERAGLLTRAAFLAGFSHRGATSPPVRGNGIQLRLLCELPVSPPPGVDLSQPTAAPGDGPKTTRELFEERTNPPMCRACHATLNGFGYALEGYDAAGHFRTRENGLPLDVSGTITGAGVDGPVTGAVPLSEALAKSPVVHRCATERMIRYAFGRAPADLESAMLQHASDAFFAGGGDVRALVKEVVLSPSFRLRAKEN